MQTAERTWSFEDKSGWPEGPWHNEPDKVQWIDTKTGFDCLIHRGPSGALCGYVGLPPGHQYHGRDYNDVYQWIEDEGRSYPFVHGGLTFADSCAEKQNENGRGICHIPEPGRPADVWWLGFDCAHSGDVCPAQTHEFGGFGYESSYRTLDYVRREVAELAHQLATPMASSESQVSA